MTELGTVLRFNNAEGAWGHSSGCGWANCSASQRFVALLVLAFMCLLPASVISAPETVRLVAEQRTTLHVGELALLRAPFDRLERPGVSGAWNDALALVRQSKREVVFRAIRPGQAVMIVTPKRRKGECISCVTVHYFVDVVGE